jgi:trans-aconitate methyltransferase
VLVNEHDGDWKAETYHRISEPQKRWGERVLSTLELRGDETVLDAGCGTGRLTRGLLERLPRGRVIALDASPAMLDVARRELASFGDRVSFVQATLARDELPTGMDVVFSTATFHWVLDHDALFGSIARALVRGGKLHAQCGGSGNLERVHSLVMDTIRTPRFTQFFASLTDPWLFAGVAETERRLKTAGFSQILVELEEAPTPFSNANAYREFMGSVVLRPFLAYLPQALRSEFVEAVTERAGSEDPPFHLDYVRLNLRGEKT